ncbi:hypothetical protein DFP72DRAFT_964752 [Ephemerocybe angulata]|uniref:BTB domain-containing protein n=1 Tax=Ephemerocybe angulata TaxID=980116 RepID=A0A8H6I086_9AGAR|nr:hypothetical protein DFP72DRAFT_964752 [Tulosesus angulatus]
MPSRSVSFYCETVIFKVEDTLFCVPRHGLEQASVVFADMFRMPTGTRETCVADAPYLEGTSDDSPIVLEGYKSSEFNSLLKFIYPSTILNDPVKEGDPTTLSPSFCLDEAEWIDVLKLATVWQIDTARDTAIHELSVVYGQTAINKIVLGRKHHVARWNEEGLSSLTTTSRATQALLEDLSGALGWETTAKILFIQQQLGTAGPPRPPSSPLVVGEERYLIKFQKKAVRCRACAGAFLTPQYNCIHCGDVTYANEGMSSVGRGITTGGNLWGAYAVRLGSIACTSVQCLKRELNGGWKGSMICPGCQLEVTRNGRVLVAFITSAQVMIGDGAESDEEDDHGAALIKRYFGEELDGVAYQR